MVLSKTVLEMVAVPIFSNYIHSSILLAAIAGNFYTATAFNSPRTDTATTGVVFTPPPSDCPKSENVSMREPANLTVRQSGASEH